MTREKKAPAIRFKGFGSKWNTKTLGELGKVATNKRIFIHQTSPTGDVPFYKIGTFGREPKLFISQELFDNYKERFPHPLKGDLLFSVIGSIGRVVEYRGKNEYFQDSNIVWLQHNGAIVNTFLKQFYSFVKWSGLEGSTIKHLYNKNILETQINLPCQKEQTQIGNFFQQLDGLIAQHQQKHDKLLRIKKALLEKMFPQRNDELRMMSDEFGVMNSALSNYNSSLKNLPAIRFKGFSGAWDVKSLGEYTKFRRGSFPQPYGNKEWYGGEGAKPFVQVVDVSNKLFLVDDTKQKISVIAQPKSVFVKQGTVVVTLQGSIGRVAVTQYDAYVDRTLLIFFLVTRLQPRNLY